MFEVMKPIKKQTMVKVKYRAAVNPVALRVMLKPFKKQTMGKVRNQAVVCPGTLGNHALMIKRQFKGNGFFFLNCAGCGEEFMRQSYLYTHLKEADKEAQKEDSSHMDAPKNVRVKSIQIAVITCFQRSHHSSL